MIYLSNMKGGQSPQGYTIVETMIFLAVSAALFASVILVVAGQQQKTEFTTGVREIQSQLQDMMSNVATGYYNSLGGYSCSTPTGSGQPAISTLSSSELGSNADCVFVGRVVQFNPSDKGGKTVARFYTLIGRRQVGSPVATDVQNINDAAPIALDQAEAGFVLPNSITAEKMTYNDGSGDINTGAVAFMSSFASRSGNGGISGSQSIDLIPIPGTLLGQSEDGPNGVKAAINGPLTRPNLSNNVIQSGTSTSVLNPSKGVDICFNSAGTSQHADILLGGSSRQVSIKVTINNGGC